MVSQILLGFGLAMLVLTTAPCFAAVTSENNPRLAEALKKFPQADANRDGVLTVAEARAFRDKAAPGAGRKSRPPQTVSGKAIGGETIEGLNGLYMGHSFFKPAAFDLLKVIPDTNVINHTACVVMQGGQGGSPKFLWNNPDNRRKGQEYLDTGKVDLLAMTCFSPEDSSLEHFAKWFDYAVSKNPEITLMVTLPWTKAPHKAEPEFLANAEKRATLMHDKLIKPLREKYPKNKVLFCPYGLGVYELMGRLEKGLLPGVNHVLNPDKKARDASKLSKDQLVNDETGHGGDLITRLNALLWLQTLYACDLSKMKPQTVEGLPDIPLNEIAIRVGKKIDPYNAVYEGK
ncbi:MAG: hypothetical protein ACPG4K_05795 [Haloferula sp.]